MDNDKEIIFNIKKKRGLSLKELKMLLKKWQNKLEMEDWDLSVEIVDFKRKNNYRQSGDFIADTEKKIAKILMTWDPWRGDEEYTLVHEMIHILLYNYDKYNEDLLLKRYKKFKHKHNVYMDKLEKTVHHLTCIMVGRSDK